MPSRLAHKKSRNGCVRCKARRVKCDETHPICNNCGRHNVECIFPPAVVPATKPKGTTSRTPQQELPGFQSLSAGEPSASGTASLDSSVKASSTTYSRSPSAPYLELHSPYSDQSEDPLTGDDRRLLEVRLLHHYMTIVTWTFPSCTNPIIREYVSLWFSFALLKHSLLTFYVQYAAHYISCNELNSSEKNSVQN